MIVEMLVTFSVEEYLTLPFEILEFIDQYGSPLKRHERPVYQFTIPIHKLEALEKLVEKVAPGMDYKLN